MDSYKAFFFETWLYGVVMYLIFFFFIPEVVIFHLQFEDKRIQK